jgi:hypothetical protein
MRRLFDPERHALGIPSEGELAKLEPGDLEDAWAYELLGPMPASMSPVRFVGRMLTAYRERLLVPLEAHAQTLPPQEAAALRAAMERARGRL